MSQRINLFGTGQPPHRLTDSTRECKHQLGDVTFVARNASSPSAEIARYAAQAIVLHTDESIHWPRTPLFELSRHYLSTMYSDEVSEVTLKEEVREFIRREKAARKHKDWVHYLSGFTKDLIEALGVKAFKISDASCALEATVSEEFYIGITKAFCDWIVDYPRVQYKRMPLWSDEYANNTPKPQYLQKVEEWPGFWDEFHAGLDVEPDQKPSTLTDMTSHWKMQTERCRWVTQESCIRSLGAASFEEPAVMLFMGLFDGICRSRNKGISCIVGNPDNTFVLVDKSCSVQDQLRDQPKMIAEWRTPWIVGMKNLVGQYTCNRDNLENRLVNAVNQVYSYMCFSNCKYGVLSNHDSTYIFQLTPGAHLANGKQEIVLQCSPEFPFDGDGLRSPIAAYLFLFIKIFTLKGESFYPPRNTDPAMHSLKFAFDVPPTIQYPFKNPATGGSVNIEPSSLEFTWNTSQENSPELWTTLQGHAFDASSSQPTPIPVIVQLYEEEPESTNPEIPSARKEIEAYTRLSHLQGTILPRIHAIGKVWGMLNVLLIEPFGRTLEEGETLPLAVKDRIIAAYRAIHQEGILCGTAGCQNILVDDKTGEVRIANFGCSMMEKDSTLRYELVIVEECLETVTWV